MRHVAIVLLARLSFCGTTASAPTDRPAGPTLKRDLNVSLASATKGDPLALRGRQSIMCAIRQDAPTACIGEIGLALEPVDPAADDERYSRTHSEHPVAIEGLDLRHLEANGYTRCVYEPDVGPVECWDRDVAQRQGQYPQPRGFTHATDVAAEVQTCVVGAGGRVGCRGAQTCFGPDNVDEPFDPTRLIDVPGVDKARLVAKGLHMACVVREDSTVACWGKTAEGGKCAPEAKVVPALGDVVDIAVANQSACALRADNRVLCWGSNSWGTLGTRRKPLFSWAPIEVEAAFPAVKIRRTTKGFAALQVDGSVVAWGTGLLGSDYEHPQRLSYERPAVDLVALDGLVCALLDNRAVQCAGKKIDRAVENGRPRPPFEGKAPWVDAPVYRLAPRPTG